MLINTIIDKLAVKIGGFQEFILSSLLTEGFFLISLILILAVQSQSYYSAYPFAHIGVVMITTIACVAGFFIGFTTHLMLTQLANKRKVEVIPVGSSCEVYK